MNIETLGNGILAILFIVALAKAFYLWDDRKVHKDKIRFK